MQYQTDENSEAMEDFSEMLTSNDSGKTKKKKHKYKTDDPDLQGNGEVFHQKPEEFEKEKRKKKKHKLARQHDNEISCDGWLVPEIQKEPEKEASSKQKKKRKHQHESEDEFSISCNVEQVVNNEKLIGTDISAKKKKKKKLHHDKGDESDNGNWLREPISTVIAEHVCEPETSSKPKKKKKHRHEVEYETAIQIENIPTISTECMKTENETICNSLEIAIQDDGSFLLPNENLPELELETSRKQKKKMKRRHEKEDEIGSEAVSCENGVPETDKVQKKKRDKHADDIFNSLSFDINWILAPVASPDHVTSNEVQHGINTYTSQATRENENGRIISFVVSPMVEPSQEPSENVLSALNVPSQEVFVNVLSATDSPVRPSENVPSTTNVPFQDTLISVTSANDSPLRTSTNFSCKTNFSPTQTAGEIPPEMASIKVPSMHESPVDLSKKTSGNVSLMHNSVVHFSQEHSSDLKRVDDSTIDLSRRTSANVSVVSSLGILQSQEHLANDSSIENPVIASSQVGPSSNFQSAKRKLFTEEVPNELSAVSKKSLPTRKVRCVKTCTIEAPEVSKKSLPTRKVRCTKTCTIEAPEGSSPIIQNSLPAISKDSLPAVSTESLPIKRVRCVKTCTIATQEGNSENSQPSQESVKRKCTQHRSSAAEKQEKRTRHPDLPKQPVSVYVRFMRDCRKELLEKNPKLRPVQIFVEAGNKYRELSDEDKEKYVNEFLVETKEYNVAIKKFLENHPEHRNRWAAEKRSGLEKRKSGSVEIISGQQLYINKRTQEHLAKQADDNIRRIMAIYRKEWKQGLNDQEKVVYVLEAKKLNAVNAASVEGPKTKDSDHAKQVTASNYHEIEEQFLQENLVPPPVNGYQLFIKENANAELPFGEINRRWKKQLSQEERNSYTTRAKLAREKYKKNLAEFEKKEEIEAEFRNLPIPEKLRNALKEEHKLLLSVRKKVMERRKKYPDIKTGRPPINGRRLFFKEQMATVKDLDFKLRFAELNARWKNQLSEEERDDYSAKAKAAHDKFMKEHPELYVDEVDEESEEQDYLTSHNSIEKTQTRKRRLRKNEGEPKQLNKRQHLSKNVLVLADV